ncbi:hypothetical protein Pan241w_47350 [Gimesia alba]|uniref:Uncharacterized protein n=1 Tax=Gimesia alba TaxID=2527973 RepID=A0A517RLC7_9PLAN|nr:hypothetical protein [Gimesia alba]QDT44622.1 hypothetical protein Pan241w_47350 [Gimesia alba]
MLLEFSSRRAEHEFSIAAYIDSMHEFFSDYIHEGDLFANVAYLWFKSCYFSFRKFTEHNLIQILNIESCYAVVDRFLLFVKVLEYLTVFNLEKNRKLVDQALKCLGTGFDESRINMISTACSGLIQSENIEYSSKVNGVIDTYTRGDYKKALEDSYILLAENPIQLEFYELYCKSLIHLGAQPKREGDKETYLSEIIENIYHVFARTPSADDSLLRLEKAAYIFWNTTLGPQLYAFVRRHQTIHDNLNLPLLREINTSVPTPRFLDVFKNSSESKCYYESFRGIFGETVTLKLFNYLLNSDSQCTDLDVPSERQLAYQGVGRIRNGEYSDAVLVFEDLKEKSSGNQIFECHAIEGLFKAFLATEQLNKCLKLVLSVYFTRREFLLSVPVWDLIVQHDILGGYEKMTHFGWAVLNSIYYKENSLPNNNKKLFILLDKFLSDKGASRPSELLSQCEEYSQSWFVYFLRYVCVTEILDSSIAYESSDDLEEERIKLCQHLLRIDSSNAEEYSNEIHRLTQARAVRDAVHQIDSSKVYVDTVGIKKSLDRAFYEGFDRYRQWYGLDESIRYSVFEFDINTKRVINKRDIIQLDAAVELFNILFHEIRYRYISSNEYGLDSYLSLRIRHGTLAGQMRRVFEERQIITTLESSTGKYHSNQYWASRFQKIIGYEKIDERLGSFSKSIDEIIDNVKRSWIQIRNEETPDGLFDFEYDDYQLASLYLKYGSIEFVGDFIDMCIEELNLRSKVVLKEVRNVIRNELCSKLINALNELEQDIIYLLPRLNQSEFSACVGKCRTDIQVELDLIAGWFETVGDATMPDYEVHHVVKTSIEMLRRTSPDKTQQLVVEKLKEWRLPGETFTYFVDMIYIPLENAVKYSLDGAENVSIKIFEKDERAAISIENSLPQNIDLEELRDLSNQLSERVKSSVSGQEVRSEGDSGYYKLGKLIQINLNMLDIEIELIVKPEPRQFSVTFVFTAEEVIPC